MIAELIDGQPVLVTGKTHRRFPVVGGEVDDKGELPTRLLSPTRISQLVDKGTWTQADLDTIGLIIVYNQETPPGERIVQGTDRIRLIGEQWTQVYTFEPIPGPLTDPVLNKRQKWDLWLQDIGLTTAEVKSMLGL